MARKLIVTQQGRIVVAGNHSYLSCGPGVWSTPRPAPTEQDDKGKPKGRYFVIVSYKNGEIVLVPVEDAVAALATRATRRRLIFDKLGETKMK